MAITSLVEATLDAVAEATDWISPERGSPNQAMDISIECSSAWVGTIQLQKRRAIGEDAKVAKEYTTDAEESLEDPVKGTQYRLYCSACTGGEAVVELYK